MTSISDTVQAIQEIEIQAVSKIGWSDATQLAVERAHRILKNIKSGFVKDHSAVMRSDGTTEFKVSVRVTYDT